ncbi:AAA family ATPase [Eggerthellaceae bacterium zg-887]|uniref:ATP-dependent nuclease n=1 Tax=Xiamenia xianingshaonis TaxID=2682776 RepID=UPI001408A814|nr:AAA family ATPase [Xiamenia xianingshaonis]NHM15286.1 AAA family ATPase [Xiamenia xianingshaonis]
MGHIELLHIEGFKKFDCFDIALNPHMNILVGENEAGKSTVLEAIRIALGQQYRIADKSVLADLFNAERVAAFRDNPGVKTLPEIIIEVYLSLDPSEKNSSFFYGEAYGNRVQQAEKYGIRFECKYDHEFGAGMEGFINEGNLPLEYYSLSWTTFANNTYKTIKRPLDFLFIDASSNAAGPSFNYYSKTLFAGKYDAATQAKAKNEFRVKLEEAFDSVGLEPISERRKFGVDGKKVLMENIISVFEDSISLENRGSGMESLIKTQIALDRASGLDVILMEEPENHLSFASLRKMLREISGNQDDSQIIITTHSNLIACSLNLNNVYWITEEVARSLRDVDEDVAGFFVKADNNSFLQLLLSKKVFLVEGATEFILLPKFYEQQTGRSIESEGVAIVSCGGISYKRYLEIAEKTSKKVAVITDNDGSLEKVAEVSAYNKEHELQHIFMDYDVDRWTWEVCLYKDNEQALKDLIETKPGAKYLFHEKDYGPILGKMLNNKADSAYQILLAEVEFAVPSYVEDAIAWLSE